MIDFHAHILPGADHGSDGLETSLRQLALAEESFSRWTQDDFEARVSPPPYDR